MIDLGELLKITLLGVYLNSFQNSSPRSRAGPYQKLISHLETKGAVHVC